MKKIFFILSSLFFVFSACVFAADTAPPVCEVEKYFWYGVNTNQPTLFDAVKANCSAVSGRLVQGQNRGTFYYDYTCLATVPCSSLSSSSLSSSSSSSVISCPAPLISNTVLQNGEWVTSCIEKPDANNASSSQKIGCNVDEMMLVDGSDGSFTCHKSLLPFASSAAASAAVSASAAASSVSNSNSSFSSPEIKTAWESCQLTFVGADCTAVASTSPCPQSVTISGQKFCVSTRYVSNSSASGSASGGGSGSGSGSGAGNGTGSGEGAGDCDPTSVDYFKCMTPDGGDMPDHTETESGFKTVADVNKNFNDRLKKSPVVGSFASVKNIISLTSSSCPEFSLTLFGREISTTVHCSMWALMAVVLSPLMIAFWTIVAFRIFASS